MRKIAGIILIFTLLSINTGVYGAVSDEEFRFAADNFLKFVQSEKRISSSEILEGNRLDPSAPGMPIACLVNLQGGGYILISVSKNLTPIKAYSLKGDFASLPEAYRNYLLSEMEANTRAMAVVSRAPQSTVLDENQKRWDFLLNLTVARLPLAYSADTFLLTTKWNQGYPYNKFLPLVEGKNVVTGCTNTAIAQIMRYYKYPIQAQGLVSYTWNNQTLKAVLYRNYNWDIMPDTLGPLTPEYQADAVASLMRDLGIANQTDYSVALSSTAVNENVLIENFGYSRELASMTNSDVNLNLFFTVLKGEIDAERPVLLSFPGHMTVADGYGADPTGKKIHVNMGWGGASDNYYYLDQIVYYEGGNFTTGADDLTIHYKIKPCSGSDCSWNLEAGDTISGLNISGQFDYGRDSDSYNVYLKGYTRVRGTRGYSNLAFRLKLINCTDKSIAFSLDDYNDPADTDILVNDNLPPGKYMVKISLCNDAGNCYPLDESDKKFYTVTIASGEVSDVDKSSIDAAIDKAPVIYNVEIYNNLKDLLLNAASQEPYRILLDVRDENGDTVTLSLKNSNPAAVVPAFQNNILKLTPALGGSGKAAKIIIVATAKGKTLEQAFSVFLANEEAYFGKSFTINSIFEKQEDLNIHKVVLNGACSISGSRGYANQAFYIAVKNAEGTTDLVLPSDQTISNYGFPTAANIYQLRAMLQYTTEGTTHIYYYDAAGVYNQYSLQVNCPDADDRPEVIAGLLGVDLSGTLLTPIVISAMGDINADGSINLTDAILVLQVLSRMDTSDRNVPTTADVNSNKMIDMAEVLYVLQYVAGIR